MDQGSSASSLPHDQPQHESEAHDHGLFTRRRLGQLMSLSGCVLCLMLFWWGGNWLRIPAHRGYEASLLQQPAPMMAIAGAWALVLLCLPVGLLLAGWMDYRAGLFTAAVGLSAWSMRGGPMHDVLVWAHSHGSGSEIMLKLAAELLLLIAPLAVAWMLLWHWHRGQEQRVDEEMGLTEPPALSDVLMGLGLQAGAMAVLVLLAVRSDMKKQALVGVGMSALLATALAEHLFAEARLGRWLWLGTVVTGLVGYVGNYASAEGWTVGLLEGPMAAMGRPLPLDYAGAGLAGTVLGYWMGTRRHLVPARLRGEE